MKKNTAYSFLTLTTALLLSGCATAGSGVSSVSIQATVEQTHRTVQSMGQDLTKLSHSTADIAVRMDASEQQLRTLITLSEDNQRSIAQVQASLDDLMRILYQREGLTPPSNTILVTPPPSGAIPATGITVSPPPGTQSNTPVGGTVIPPVSNNNTLTAPPLSAVNNTAVTIKQHYALGQDFYRKEEFSRALQQFDEHITKFPTSQHVADATYWKAHCYYKLEDYPQAVKGYEQLRTQFPSSTKISFSLYNEAAALMKLGQTQKAKTLLQQLIREYPDDANAEYARQGLRQLQGLVE